MWGVFSECFNFKVLHKKYVKFTIYVVYDILWTLNIVLKMNNNKYMHA